MAARQKTFYRTTCAPRPNGQDGPIVRRVAAKVSRPERGGFTIGNTVYQIENGKRLYSRKNSLSVPEWVARNVRTST